jgi:hypothetical protein
MDRSHRPQPAEVLKRLGGAAGSMKFHLSGLHPREVAQRFSGDSGLEPEAL